MTQEQLNELIGQVGKQAAEKIAAEMKTIDARAEQIVAQKGASKEDFEAFKQSAGSSFEELKEIARKQGVALNDLLQTVTVGAQAKGKTLEQVIKSIEPQLQEIHSNGTGQATILCQFGKNGEIYAVAQKDAKDAGAKAAGVTGTIDGLSGGGSTASISQALGAQALLRVADGAEIMSNYRNGQYLFPLMTQTRAGFNTNKAIWIEEQAMQGGSDTVAEGASAPLSQYDYEIKSADYRKEATLITMTDEYSIDFPRLESHIMSVAPMDIMNSIQAKVLTRLKAAATAYSTDAEFLAANGGAGFSNLSNHHIIAALAAQVANATYSEANVALMNTFVAKVMGVAQTADGVWLDKPSMLNPIAYVSNPAIAAADLFVGDLRQYNMIWRDGFEIKIGYNGTNFAEGKFSIIMRQFYFDYIAEVRKPAIVKGDWATIRTALTA